MATERADYEVERIARLMHKTWQDWAKVHDPDTYRTITPWNRLPSLRLEAMYAVARAVIDDPGKRM